MTSEENQLNLLGIARRRERLTDNSTLREARDWLRMRAEDGERCPCCTQFTKVYKRKINSSMAADLIAMYRAFGTDWGYLPNLRRRTSRKGNREESKLRYWGLVEEEIERRPDGGRSGWWRVTPDGERFVRLEITLPKYARIFDGRGLGLTGPPVSIRECLGQAFSYEELMSW